MNIVWASIIIVAVTAFAVTAMLLMRRRAPDGGYVADGDRAAGVFGVVATGFSVLLGFLIFLAFESYDTSRSGAEIEAMNVVQQAETAQLLPDTVSDELTGQLVCYARSVIHREWDQMEDGSIGNEINPWGAKLFFTSRGADPQTTVEQAAYSKWLDQTSDREQARQDRIHGASGVMPTPLWIVLAFISVVVFAFMLAFADSGERAIVQALYMGSVVSIIMSMLLLLNFLDHPFNSGIGGLEPAAMERTVRLLDEEIAVAGLELTYPCDDLGAPV